MKCPNCGAEVSTHAAKCEFCDSAVEPKTARVAAAASSLADADVRAAVFARIAQSDAYRQRDSDERRAALPQGTDLNMLVPVAFFVVFAVVGLIIFSGAIGMSGVVGSQFGAAGLIPAAMSIVPLGFVALGIFMAVRQFGKFRDYQESPLLAHPAIIAAKRTEVSGGSGNSSASTSYFITAEFADGRREEFAVFKSSLYGRLAENDAGVLFSRGEFALDFDRAE